MQNLESKKVALFQDWKSSPGQGLWQFPSEIWQWPQLGERKHICGGQISCTWQQIRCLGTGVSEENPFAIKKKSGSDGVSHLQWSQWLMAKPRIQLYSCTQFMDLWDFWSPFIGKWPELLVALTLQYEASTSRLTRTGVHATLAWCLTESGGVSWSHPEC